MGAHPPQLAGSCMHMHGKKVGKCCCLPGHLSRGVTVACRHCMLLAHHCSPGGGTESEVGLKAGLCVVVVLLPCPGSIAALSVAACQLLGVRGDRGVSAPQSSSRLCQAGTSNHRHAGPYGLASRSCACRGSE